jgi:hypothetical protein
VEDLRDGDPREIGSYTLTARLGAGGMGLVFLGQSASGRLVAVKVIHPQLAMDKAFRARFDREIAAARRVGGFYAAPVVDADSTGPQPWLAVGYVDGPSLAEAVAENGPMPPESLLVLAAGLAEGLGAVHAAGVVHRDLKPSNVMLAADGVRVIDFGIAQAADDTTLTGTGLVIGSPGYMSPEQADGRAVGPASDVFSMGGVLVFAATGEGPFGAGRPAEQLFRVVHGSPRLAGLPPGLRALVAQCMDKDPARRPTAGQFLARLPRVSRAPAPGRPAFEWGPAAQPAPSERPAQREAPAEPGPVPVAAGQSPAAADVTRGDEAPAELAAASAGATQTMPPAGNQSLPGPSPAPARAGTPAPPVRRANHRRLRWAIPVTAAVAAGLVLAALLATRRAPPLPVLRPAGLTAVATSYSTIAIEWSGPKSGLDPDKYQILQDGAVVATVPGHSTRYQRTRLSPATSYRFQVIAIRGAMSSPASAVVSARTGTPPLSDAMFSNWNGTVRSTTTSVNPASPFSPFGAVGTSSADHWVINETCGTPRCDAIASGSLSGVPFEAVLSRSDRGTTYTGATFTGAATVGLVYPLNPGAPRLTNFSGCYRVNPVPGTLSIRVTVTHASPAGGLWAADKWSGTATALNVLDGGTCGIYSATFTLRSS